MVTIKRYLKTLGGDQSRKHVFGFVQLRASQVDSCSLNVATRQVEESVPVSAV
jgi:hypothetical protein